MELARSFAVESRFVGAADAGSTGGTVQAGGFALGGSQAARFGKIAMDPKALDHLFFQMRIRRCLMFFVFFPGLV